MRHARLQLAGLLWAHGNFQVLNPLSTEGTGRSGPRQLYAMANGQWLRVPPGAYDMQLNGSEYWVSVGLGNSSDRWPRPK